MFQNKGAGRVKGRLNNVKKKQMIWYWRALLKQQTNGHRRKCFWRKFSLNGISDHACIAKLPHANLEFMNERKFS